ncbi:MAG: hypothetical protein GW949_03460 [Spirochaetales bacterium]|nr:hypothetical protein [Spirochaetales bacterium]
MTGRKATKHGHLYSLFGLILLFMLGSCGGDELPQLDLPSEQVLIARGNAALVIKPYARVHELPNPQSPVRNPVRLGEIGTIEAASSGQSLVSRKLDYWYYVRFATDGTEFSGWIFGGDLEIYANLARAQNAATQLRAANE